MMMNTPVYSRLTLAGLAAKEVAAGSLRNTLRFRSVTQVPSTSSTTQRGVVGQQQLSMYGVRGLSTFANDPKHNNNAGTKQEEAPSIGMPWTRKLSTADTSAGTLPAPLARKYHWIDEEAERLIGIAYKLHLPDQKPFPPSVGFDRKRLEELTFLPHYVPQDLSDKFALAFVGVLEKVMHMFFRSKYDHHAVTLETVAAVPGFLAAIHRHMRSLRRMKRDHGWIDNLLEEATNERMHLLIWMQMTQPNFIERMFVLAAQGGYIMVYSTLYFISPKTAHRTVGYLEESAFRAYTDYLKAVDSGAIPNRVLNERSIGKKFYRLPEGSTLRDIILHVRADEAFHALYNHGLSNQIQKGGYDEDIIPPGER